MRIRHRVPTIFNLSMVDVLCCALGCVILLWLLNQRDANDQASGPGYHRKNPNPLEAAAFRTRLLTAHLVETCTVHVYGWSSARIAWRR